MNRAGLLSRVTDPDDILVCDGAMGTMLYSRGVFINQCYDELSLRAPELVRGVHEEYVRAGAELLETNSFGANRARLAQYGLEEQVGEINVAAARLARAAAGDDVLVAGAIGPLGIRLEPYGPTSREEARAMFAEQMTALLEGGVDLLLLETFGDLLELEQAVLAAREVGGDRPLISQMTIGVDGRTPFGASAEDVARALDRFGAEVVGLNCSVGPQIILEAIEAMARVTQRRLVAQPNAGLPRDVGGRRMYMASAEYMGTYARHLVQAGARMVGGCCGTTPEHVRAMVDGVRPLSPRASRGPRSTVAVGEERGSGHGESRPSTRRGERTSDGTHHSRWAARLAAGEFVTTVEVVPPRGVDVTRLLADATRLKEAGVDAINIPDGPRAQSRMSALATSVLVEQRVGLETMAHYCCRDRNLLGMLSDLLGASALGLRNLLLITGDPPKMGPYPDATAVFDIDSIGLTNLVSNLNRGLDPGGNDIGEPTHFVIGVGVNPAAVDPVHELERLGWKVDAGADFVITQPVFDVAQLERFLDSMRATNIPEVPMIAGVWPLVSARNAEFLANEVPGVTVPPRVLERMRRASERSRDHGVAEGIAIAREMLSGIRDTVRGVQLSAPFGRVELALDVLAG